MLNVFQIPLFYGLCMPFKGLLYLQKWHVNILCSYGDKSTMKWVSTILLIREFLPVKLTVNYFPGEKIRWSKFFINSHEFIKRTGNIQFDINGVTFFSKKDEFFGDSEVFHKFCGLPLGTVPLMFVKVCSNILIDRTPLKEVCHTHTCTTMVVRLLGLLGRGKEFCLYRFDCKKNVNFLHSIHSQLM